MVDAGDAVSVFADLPGCDRERIELRASANEIRVEAERDDDVGDNRTHRRERAATIERTIEVPERADVDEAVASYENGVLRIDLPKREEHAARVENAIGFE